MFFEEADDLIDYDRQTPYTIERIEIKNGINSKSILISQFLWYLKSMLPKSFGGI